MSTESSTVSHMSVVMTTDQGEVTQTTVASDMTSSSSRHAAVYFECAVLFIGVVGTAANGLVLYALVASKQHKKHVLIVNQNALDLYSCILLVIIYALKLFNIRLTGSLGYWLCKLLFSENLLWCGVHGSLINLMIIAIERYLKVVHAVWSQNNLRQWLIYSAMAFSWIISFVSQMAVSFESSAVINGVCYGYVVWENLGSKMACGIFYFFVTYVIEIVVFIFCYGKILITVRRQARVMAAHSGRGSSTAQTQLDQIQTNVIKTMSLVCAFYAIAWLPESIYILVEAVNPNITFLLSAYYSVLFVAFLYICTKLNDYQHRSLSGG